MNNKNDHISVCICTYKRMEMLAKLLEKLKSQATDDLFTYSIVVVDNDHKQSSKNTINSFKEKSLIDIVYFCEPDQNISLARNKAIQNGKGNYLALIDDDEYPVNEFWLLTLYKTLYKYKSDGVLGPVEPKFEIEPPQWIVKGKVFVKPTYKQRTGLVLQWKDTRTSNVLISKKVFSDDDNKFNPNFGRTGGEDVDFFKKMIEKGFVFVWCNEAPVYETIKPVRCKRLFLLKKALLRGSVSLAFPSFGILDVVKSLTAFFLYTPLLPLFFFIRHHLFMKYLIKDCDHIGKLLAVCGLRFIKERDDF